MKRGSWTRRVSAFGDLPTRLLMRGLKVAPGFLEPVLVPVWTAGFFVAVRAQRRAVTGNLRALFPEWGGLRAAIGAYRVFHTSRRLMWTRCGSRPGPAGSIG